MYFFPFFCLFQHLYLTFSHTLTISSWIIELQHLFKRVAFCISRQRGSKAKFYRIISVPCQACAYNLHAFRFLRTTSCYILWIHRLWSLHLSFKEVRHYFLYIRKSIVDFICVIFLKLFLQLLLSARTANWISIPNTYRSVEHSSDLNSFM